MKSLANAIGALTYKLLFTAIIAVATVSPAYGEDGKDIKAIAEEIAVRTETIQFAEIQKSKNEFVVFDRRSATRFNLGATAPTEQGRTAFNNMSASDRERFLKIRENFFKVAVPILTRSEIGLGFGSIIKKTLRHFFRKKAKYENPIEELAKASLPDDEETPKNIRGRGHTIMFSVLRNFDKKLWEGCQSVVDNNELALQASLSFVLGSTTRIRVKDIKIPMTNIVLYRLNREVQIPGIPMGGSIGYGFKLGFNTLDNSAVFEIYKEVEKIGDGFMPLLAGIIPKIGLFIGNNTPEGAQFEGDTIYPPFAYVSKGEGFKVVGGTTSIISFPSALSEAFVWECKVTTKPVKRIYFQEKSSLAATLEGMTELERDLYLWDNPHAAPTTAEACTQKLKSA